MTALISLIIAIVFSILVTRITAVAFTLIGLSRDVADLQALSAFSGVGFTTSESDHVTEQPERRHILMLVIRLGNIGVVTVISSLVLTFVNTASAQEQFTRFLWLAAGLIILFL